MLDFWIRIKFVAPALKNVKKKEHFNRFLKKLFVESWNSWD